MRKLCYVATIPAVVHAFLRPHISASTGKYHVTIICNELEKEILKDLDARFIFLPITRKPSLLRDLFALLQLILVFRRERFDIVHSIMPKTGFLAMMAGWASGVPLRIHTFTGQVWVTMHGIKRLFFKWMDTLIAHFATLLLADSRSQLDFLIQQKVLPADKGTVVGEGSICGVDLNRFMPDADVRRQVRDGLGIDQFSPLVLFVGRLNSDKGILDLAKAFNKVALNFPSACLLLVGAEENVMYSDVQEICHDLKHQLRYIPFSTTPEHFMAAADIFCLPSYREGFGMTIIEAAACGVPTIATRIYGVTDAVVDGSTGYLFEPSDVDCLVSLLNKLFAQPNLRRAMGEAARCRVINCFSSDRVSRGMQKIYDSFVDNYI